ncbi:NB-ARC domain-containing protein [Vibrio parahaemolyticus]|uniref:tetratricopeptide repeat protein n=1 Tax=Vibrio parahaemolyticus TaxID=670 RepID=UPI0027E455E3|nr:tetratricopeptide repeat protein [Vibrio parahaemolyticus]WMN98240.1 NB-ARC domain-containing protein [Vibrio parahaemolyticus]
MAFNLTRMTVYALISAIEQDLRDMVTSHMTDKTLLTESLVERASLRFMKDNELSLAGDEDIGLEDLVSYFDLGDTFQVINANKSLFPSQLISHIKANTKSLELLVPIRNRVMHIRPLDFEDLPSTSSLCQMLVKEEPDFWRNTVDTLGRLDAEPSFVLSLEIPSLDEITSVKHNLPLPDFDETGLIGRDEDVDKVKRLCLGGFPVISIVGEGGVGKTALALKVAYELLEDPCCPFDAVIWVSSKTSQITVNEIVEFKGAISDSLGMFNEIESELIGEGISKKESFDEIIDYLATFKIALFIDNLETILDDNIREFIGSLPSGSKIIITSRIGLGAFEYPVKLQGIEEGYASQLLRTLSKLRGIDTLAKLPQKTLIKYVNRMHRNPSYIKWFVSSVQTGLAPEVVLQHSDLFLEFCMSNVYKYLSPNARTLTDAMQCAHGLKDLPELAYLTEFDALTVQKATQELMATNMMTQSSDSKGASVKTRYQLSELARAYLSKHHKPSQATQKQIRAKQNQLNSVFERQMKRRSNNKYQKKNIKFRDKSDRVVAKMLTDAITHLNNNQYGLAYDLLDEAHRMSPDYFEVPRVFAQYYEIIGNIAEAREQYELAIVLEPDAPQLHHWFGKFLLQKDDNVDEAIVQFQRANKLDPSSFDTALSLARCFMFASNYDETEKLLATLKEDFDRSPEHLQKIYLDTEIQISYRLADDFCRDGNIKASLERLERMRELFDALPEHFKDRYMRKKLAKAKYTFSHVQKSTDFDLQERISQFGQWLHTESTDG